jgi:hypothetical protein
MIGACLPNLPEAFFFYFTSGFKLIVSVESGGFLRICLCASGRKIDRLGIEPLKSKKGGVKNAFKRLLKAVFFRI